MAGQARQLTTPVQHWLLALWLFPLLFCCFLPHVLVESRTRIIHLWVLIIRGTVSLQRSAPSQSLASQLQRPPQDATYRFSSLLQATLPAQNRDQRSLAHFRDMSSET